MTVGNEPSRSRSPAARCTGPTRGASGSMTVPSALRRIAARKRPADGIGRSSLPPPPGGLDPLDEPERADRLFLRRRAEEFGPVFSGTAWGNPYVCIMGLARCRQFLALHEQTLVDVTQDISMVTPKGALSAMNREDHTHYRRILLGALRSGDAQPVDSVLVAMIDAALADCDGRRWRESEPADASREFTSAMSALATHLLLTVFFGAAPGSAPGRLLVDGFADLGPYGLVWNLGPRQIAAYSELHRVLRDELALRDGGDHRLADACLMVSLDSAGVLDETMLINLVQMAEMGRSDIANLFRWITRYAALHPELLTAIKQESDGRTAHRLTDAFVMEVLRSDQSERLERRTTCDIDFEGFAIPAGTSIRLCLWEAHHDEKFFPDPFRFDPSRFTAVDPPANDVFAPFGVRLHQCPFGSVTMRVGALFVRRLAEHHRPVIVRDGPPVRGPYHWEAARTLAIDMESNRISRT